MMEQCFQGNGGAEELSEQRSLAWCGSCLRVNTRMVEVVFGLLEFCLNVGT